MKGPLLFFCNRKLLKVREFQPCLLSSSTKMANRYKDNFICFIIFFFFQKIKTFGVETIDKRLWKKCVILMECWSWPLFVALATVKVICYFHMWRYHVFAQKLTWYFIGVYMIRENKQWFCYKKFWWVLRLILWKILSPCPPMSSSPKKQGVINVTVYWN